MRALTDESEFERELRIFQKDHEEAQQYFFVFVSLRGIAASNSDVLKSMNEDPPLMADGREPDAPVDLHCAWTDFRPQITHNINRLNATATKEIAIFSREAWQLGDERRPSSWRN